MPDKLVKAITDCTEAIERNSGNPEYYINRALAYMVKGRHNNATNDFSKAKFLDPDYTFIYLVCVIASIIQDIQARLDMAGSKTLVHTLCTFILESDIPIVADPQNLLDKDIR